MLVELMVVAAAAGAPEAGGGLATVRAGTPLMLHMDESELGGGGKPYAALDGFICISQGIGENRQVILGGKLAESNDLAGDWSGSTLEDEALYPQPIPACEPSVPEPASIAVLMTIGVSTLVARRRSSR